MIMKTSDTHYMNEEPLNGILFEYGIKQPDITFIRHNENRTYKVNDIMGLTKFP